LPALGELLIDASKRMQLIVTTQSDILVSALSDVPEAVVVCERDDRGSHLHRLDAQSLSEWLEKYSLGELWRMGEVEGNLRAGRCGCTSKAAARTRKPGSARRSGVSSP
jgi:hypothetical protein